MHPDVASVRVVSRRDPKSPTLGDILKQDVSAVALCRESECHGRDALACVRAGKHILVEYPLSTSVREAEMIFAEAKTRSCRVHVGFLGLLSPWSTTYGDLIRGANIKSAAYGFKAGFGQVPKADVGAKRWGTMVLARLHQLVNWFGLLRVTSAEVSYHTDGCTIFVDLITMNGQHITLIEERQTGIPRGRHLKVKLMDTSLLDGPSWQADPGSFSKDTWLAVARFAGEDVIEGFADQGTILHGLALAETITRRAVAVERVPM
jgi:hypothetical protein